MKYKIYRIVDNTNGNIYIGKTIKTLNHRISGHKSDYKCNRGNCSSKIILQNEDWFYELVEDTDDKRREAYWIKNTSSCINKRKLDLDIKKTNRKHYLKNKTKLNEQKKKYNIDNKTELLEYAKQYRLKNRELKNEKQNEIRYMNKFGNVIYKYLLDMDLL